MKKLIIYLLLPLFLSCTGTNEKSPSETAKIVAESFYQGDKVTLKKYTTKEGFANLSSIQDLFAQDKDSASEFKLIEEKTSKDIAWIKYSTSYDPKPGVFKLVQEDGQWKVTHNGPQEKIPF